MVVLMSRLRNTSPRLRYLKARLSIFTSPSFLAGVIFLVAVGLVVKEYWANSEFLKFSQNEASLQEDTSESVSASNSQSLLSDEDRAIAADIGNISVLDYDREKSKLSLRKKVEDAEEINKQTKTKLTKLLDNSKKNQKEKEIKPSTDSVKTSNPPISQNNPFLNQAQSLLQFNFGSNQQAENRDNLSPFSSSQPSQSSLNFGFSNTSPSSQNRSPLPDNALKAAIEKSATQAQDNSQTKASANNQNTLSQSSQADSKSTTNPSPNQRLRPNPNSPLVDTTILNQPANNQVQNPYNNYNQFGTNSQTQIPYSNFSTNQLPATNFNRSGSNNQIQTPYSNFGTNQLPATNFIPPTINNQIQNPNNNFNNQLPANNYNRANNNQIPTNLYRQPGLNNQVQNPYNGNSNNNMPIRASRFNAQTQQRINNIYNRLQNRNNPNTVNSNTYPLPINRVNTRFQQPSRRQFNSPYINQSPVQYPNNGYQN